jgi:tol-pal system protein YbgF
MRLSILLISIIFSFIGIKAQADTAPVVDLNDLPESTAPASPVDTSTVTAADPMASRQALPMDKRVQLLEQQLSNLTQMNLPAKVESLEQQIHQLNGQLEEQAHTVAQLQSQLSAQKNPEPILNNKAADPAAAAKAPVQTQTTSVTTSVHSNALPTDTAKEAVAKEASSPILVAETAVVQNKVAAPAAKDANTEFAAEKAYQMALDLMIKKQNTQAISAFKKFLQNYASNVVYAPSAHYWLGELYSMDNKNSLASKEFTTLIQKYATHSKVPDALLKLAIIHDEAGQHAQAKQELQKLIQQFPSSKAAELAKGRLKGMKT